MASKISDEEISDVIMDLFYGNGEYPRFTMGFVILKLMGEEEEEFIVHFEDAFRIWNKLQRGGFIVLANTNDVTYSLSYTGAEIMRKYGKFSKYLKSDYVINKDRRELFDRRIKNVGILATLLVSIATLLLTQLSKPKGKELQEIKEHTQSTASKLDSILNILHQPQTLKEQSQKVDTPKVY